MAVNLSDANLTALEDLSAAIRENRRLIAGYQSTIDQTQAARDTEQSSLVANKTALRDLITAMTV